jgi:hypothetical protein
MYNCTLSLTSTLHGRGLSTPRPGRFTPGKDSVPIVWGCGGPQGRSGGLRKIPPPTGILSPERPVRSESLYRLSCHGPLWLSSVRIHSQKWYRCRSEHLVLYNQHSELRKSTSLLGVTFQNTYGPNTPWYKVFTDQYLKGHITKKFLVVETLNHYSVNRYINAWSVFTDSPSKEIPDFRNQRFIMFIKAWTSKLFTILFSRTPHPFAS